MAVRAELSERPELNRFAGQQRPISLHQIMPVEKTTSTLKVTSRKSIL